VIEVGMPKFGLSMEKGFITKWYKKEGEEVKEGEALFEAESEKITNDVPSPASGFLKKIIVKEGEEQEVGKVVAYIAENEKELGEEIKIEKEKSKESVSGKVGKAPEIKEKTESKAIETGFIKASPIAKRLAKEYGVDLSALHGSGPGGRIIEKDVLSAVKGKGTLEEEKLSPLRKTIAENLAKSYREAVLVTNMTEVDMSALFEFKNSLPEKISVTAILVKIIANVLKELPEFNVNFDGETVKKFTSVNIGIAVSTTKGLIVPVIKNAELLSLSEINKEIKRLSESARKGNLTPDELSDSHFTITNLGMMRTDMFTPVLNKNEVAIMGVGRTVKKPVVIDNDSIAIRPMSWFSLSYDHRVIDGADAAEFLGKVADFAENKDFYVKI
jgi:pyruvate dehydrogenase E2 component (dihydrolipoamide acetyltransferase)